MKYDNIHGFISSKVYSSKIIANIDLKVRSDIWYESIKCNVRYKWDISYPDCYFILYSGFKQ